MQQETTKLLVVKTDPSLPSQVNVSMLDLRDAVLQQPEIIIDALRHLIAGAGTDQSGTPPPTGTPPGPGGPGGQGLPGGDLPMDTPIFKLLPPDQAAILTANAKKLTKADLLALGGMGVPRKAATDFNLTVDDVKTIQEAFHQSFVQDMTGQSGLAPVKIEKCCCSPCCCCSAAADVQPRQPVA